MLTKITFVVLENDWCVWFTMTMTNTTEDLILYYSYKTKLQRFQWKFAHRQIVPYNTGVQSFIILWFLRLSRHSVFLFSFYLWNLGECYKCLMWYEGNVLTSHQNDLHRKKKKQNIYIFNSICLQYTLYVTCSMDCDVCCLLSMRNKISLLLMKTTQIPVVYILFHLLQVIYDLLYPIVSYGFVFCVDCIDTMNWIEILIEITLYHLFCL